MKCKLRQQETFEFHKWDGDLVALNKAIDFGQARDIVVENLNLAIGATIVEIGDYIVKEDGVWQGYTEPSFKERFMMIKEKKPTPTDIVNALEAEDE